MEADHQVIVDTILKGGTVDEAAQHIGKPLPTVRRWLSQGRKYPDGQWGELSRSADAARVACTNTPEAAGNCLAEVEALVEQMGEVSADLAPRIGLLRTIARKLDWAEKTQTGIAAMAAERLANRYSKLLDEIQPISSSDNERLIRALWSGAHEDQFRRVLESIADGTLKSAKAVAAAERVLVEAEAADERVAADGIYG